MKEQLSQLKFYVTIAVAVSSAMTGAYGLYTKALNNTQEVKQDLIERLNYIEQVKLDTLQTDMNKINANIVQIMTKLDIRPILSDNYQYSSYKEEKKHETFNTP